MSDKLDPNLLRHHDYDGIHELDNPLPSWWLWTFYLAIIFSFLYIIHYQFGGGASLQQEFAAQMRFISTQQASTQRQTPSEISDEQLAALSSDPQIMAQGADVFAGKCAACHGQEGQGMIGPNLTDRAWLHGPGGKDIYKAVAEGVLDKGMPAWKSQLSRADLTAVVTFVITLKGKEPANAKAAQGIEY